MAAVLYLFAGQQSISPPQVNVSLAAAAVNAVTNNCTELITEPNGTEKQVGAKVLVRELGGKPEITNEQPDASEPSGTCDTIFIDPNGTVEGETASPSDLLKQPALDTGGGPSGINSSISNPNSSSNNTITSSESANVPSGPIFNETTGQWETSPAQPQPADYPTTILPSQNSPTGSVFNETTGQWENLTYSSGCSLLLGTCDSAPPETTYPTSELPSNPLDSRLQPPGTVLQYTEGAQNYQYAYPNSTFNQTAQPQTPPPAAPSQPSQDSQTPQQGASSPALSGPGDALGAVFQWLLGQEISNLFR